MLKVFLVEDESVIREGLRDNIPWEQYGFEFVGEASDGEMALPLIRKRKPDVIITDIKMPFMDGLSMSEIVKKEFPRTRIIIISGYDDFEYARRALVAGVDQYLLKPVTRANLRKVLLEMKDKIEKEAELNDYQIQFQNEMQAFEQFSLRSFFENLLEGKLDVKDIYEEAARLSLEIMAPCYNLLVFTVYEKEKQPSREKRELFVSRQEEIFHFFLRRPQFILFRLNVSCYGVLIKSEAAHMEELVENSLEHFRRVCGQGEEKIDWYVAVGTPVERLSLLPQCYKTVSHYLAYRFILPSAHILTEKTLADHLAGQEEKKVEGVDFLQMDPEIIRDFLARGSINEINDFVESYQDNIREALKSRMFRNYVIFNIRFAAISFLESMHVAKEDYMKRMDAIMEGVQEGEEDFFHYYVSMLRYAMETRDQINNFQGKKHFQKVLDYIDENYDCEGLSLNMIAEQVGMSASYLSAIFSQNMPQTCTTYITEKRMEKAKKLLRQTDKSTTEIAREVGYKDSRYFNFVFRKFMGVSPREYRGEKK